MVWVATFSGIRNNRKAQRDYDKDLYKLNHLIDYVPPMNKMLTPRKEMGRKVTCHKPRITGLIRTSEKPLVLKKQIVQFLLAEKVIDFFGLHYLLGIY